jgi:cell division protein FtsW (lipid II flippase)
MSEIPHEHVEKPEHKKIGLIIAVLAVVLAVIGSLAKDAANQMIVNEVKSSNGFAWYQSKRMRSYMNEMELDRINTQESGAISDQQRELLLKQKAKLTVKNAEYKTENEDILKKAESQQESATIAAHRHHGFERAEVFLHIAVVLCSVTLLTDRKIFSRVGVGLGLVGVILASYTYFHHEQAQGASGSEPQTTQPAAKAH